MTLFVRNAIKNVTFLLSEEQTEILKTAGLLMAPSIIGKLLGQIYTVLVATQLGNGIELADFNTANAVPQFVTNILLLGLVGSIVVPIFIDAKEHGGRERFLKVFNTVVNTVLLIFIVITLILFLSAPQILDIFIPISDYPGNRVLVIDMMRFLMIPNFILGISMFMTSGLNVYHRILVPQLSPVMFGVGRIFAVLIILPLMNNSPWALTLGVLIGSILHLLIQIPLARMLKIEFKLEMDTADPYFRRIVSLSIPRSIAFGAEQLGLLVVQSIASGITLVRDAGVVTAITVFSYANALALVIPSLFGYSFAAASFPTISKLYSRRDFGEISKIVVQTINNIFFLSIPFIVTLIILRLPAVRLIFGLLPGTAFGRQDTILVAWILLFLALGLLFSTQKWYLYRVFYAAKNTKTPLVISMIALGITVLFSWLFTNYFSHASDISIAGLSLDLNSLFSRAGSEAAVAGGAAGISVASTFEFFALIFFIDKKVVPLDFIKLKVELYKKLVPTVTMSGLMYFMFKTWDYLSFPIDKTPGFFGSTTLNLFVLTSLTVMTCFMVFYLMCYLFQVEELKILRRFLNPLFRLGGFEIEE